MAHFELPVGVAAEPAHDFCRQFPKQKRNLLRSQSYKVSIKERLTDLNFHAMAVHLTVRRFLAACLALCCLGQIAWLDAHPASRSSAILNRQVQGPSGRVVLSSDKGSSVGQATHWLIPTNAVRGDSRPHWNFFLLAGRESKGFVPSPDAASRFGRAPPSSMA